MQWWIEVIDPANGRKVDVTVGFHASWPDERPELVDTRERVLAALRAAGFALSDLEAVDA